MQPPRIILAFATALALVVPLATAAPWVAEQNVEPDNALDTADFMWQDGPGAATKRVYFAAMTYSMRQNVNVNWNVAALGTNNEAPGSEWHEAILGVWVDCNGDNYIGTVEGAMREYPTALLPDDTLCPPINGDPNEWPAGAHNYRGLVTEFVAISPDPDALEDDKRLYIDPDARVWGDFGRHNALPTQRSCTLAPQARGTFQSTGGTLNWVDCRYDILGIYNTGASLAGLPMFADDENAEGSFADFETFGSEDSQYAAVSVVDCSANEPMIDTAENVNETGAQGPLQTALDAASDNTPLNFGQGWEWYKVTVATIDPKPMNTQNPNLPGQVNQTDEEVNGDCDTSNDRGDAFYGQTCAVVACVGEADFNGVDPKNKREADWNFGWQGIARGSVETAPLEPDQTNGTAGWDSFGYGLGVSQPILSIGGPRWYSDSTWLSKPGPASVKTDLKDPSNPGVGLADGYFLTFYAFVGPSITGILDVPGEATPGTYGGWHCDGVDEGTPRGFNCDPETWYVNPDGTLLAGRESLATVGDLYNLRDTDCYDGTSSAAGVALYPAGYGDNPCP